MAIRRNASAKKTASGKARRTPLDRFVRGIGFVALGLLLAILPAALGLGIVVWYLNPPLEEVRETVYGERDGRPLTYHVIAPERKKNGYGVLFLVSGSWKSKPSLIRPWVAGALLRKGYTVLAVCHLSQPEVTIGEIVEDTQRAVRHIRHHAGDLGIDPDYLGVSGGSSGGHLALMLATQGGHGLHLQDAPDPVDRESSEVQAVAVFFPVTDLLNLGDSTENPGDGGPPLSYVNAFGPGVDQAEVWQHVGRELSPIYHIRESMPPVFIMHGDADVLVPLDQSTRFREAAREAGGEVELMVRRGKAHGWIAMVWDLRNFADWYDLHLRKPTLGKE